MTPFFKNWTRANGDSVAQLTAITGAPGHLWPYPQTALPAGIANGMPHIQDLFISGYVKPTEVQDGLEAIGELLVTRKYDAGGALVPESGKAYMYLVAVDEQSQPYFRGPYKPYEGHYYNQGSGVPIEKLFGEINLQILGKTVI